MRTNIVIDDELMNQALKLTGISTKRAAVKAGLELLVQLARQERIRASRGKLEWIGDLEDMRRNRS